MVFTWHFTHYTNGYPVAFSYTPNFFPLAILDEGHAGVALFMTLSGYIFAKLLDGNKVSYMRFLWNRVVRLVPLLVVVIVLVGLQRQLAGDSLMDYFHQILAGVALPTLPNGGWSITVEAHFYVILPLLLLLEKRWRFAPLILAVVALLFRLALHAHRGEVQSLAYWTIIGHVDQFLMGIFAFRYRLLLKERYFASACIALSFCLFYWHFDRSGGFYLQPDGYPSGSLFWIIIPFAEALAYSALIAFYDTTFQPSTKGISGFIGQAGAYSYSIYLLHFFVAFHMARFIDTHWMDLSNFLVAMLWALACFCTLVPIGWLSYRFIESPFLRLRLPYLQNS